MEPLQKVVPLAVKKTRPLTFKQEKYCHEYIRDLNIPQAFVRAGYKLNGKNAYKLHDTPYIQAKIDELLAERYQLEEVTEARVQRSLLRIADLAEDDRKWTAALKAWELLGKDLGMFVEKTSLEVISNKSEDQLDEDILHLNKILGFKGAKNES